MLKIPVDNCCGCTACYSVCPKEAIQMLPDKEGFLYPTVNSELCVSCGLCEKVCPIMHPAKLTESYAQCVVAQSEDEEVINSSTAGGFIDALYYYALENLKGFAAGVAFDENFMPLHLVTDKYEEAKAFRNSKYAQSELGGVFKKIRSVLDDGHVALFVGTACQVAGLKTYLRRDYENLITVDLVCRSVPSAKFWRAYLQWQECRHKARISSVACRRKTYGYHSGALEIEFAGGKKYRGSNRVDYFMKSFHHDICSRPSCYQCTFKCKHRCSDFTVFDSWNPQLVALEPLVDDNRGFSNVLVHTQKGNEILGNLAGLHMYRADPEKMFLYTGGMESKSIKYSKAREKFYEDLDSLGFEKTVKKYISVSLKDRLIERAKPIYYAFKNR